MDTSEIYINMCNCEEVQSHEFDSLPNFHFAYDFYPIWRIENDILGGQNDKKVWLPRQDQIQEMIVKDDFHRLFTSLYRFWGNNWDEESVSKVNSMEQFWLVFYMQTKHKLIWDGEEWIKK